MKKYILSIICFLCVNIYYSQTQEELWNEIIKNDIKQPSIVFRQAMWETGWLKSYACQHRHNLFGFINGKKVFKTWQESVIYYKNWQNKYYKNEEEDYYHFLNRIGYASAKGYIKALKSIKVPIYVY